MWSLSVEEIPLLSDHDLRLTQAVGDLPVEELIAEPGLEALAVSIPAKWSRLDVSSLGANGGNPALNCGQLSDHTCITRHCALSFSLDAMTIWG